MATELTPREIEVMTLLMDGHSKARIANELAVSVLTVESHVSKIYRKSGAQVRVDVARWAIENGIDLAKAGLLSAREIELLKLVAAGRNRQQIAEMLRITFEMVNADLARICFKIGVRSRDEAVQWAIDNRIVRPDEF